MTMLFSLKTRQTARHLLLAAVSVFGLILAVSWSADASAQHLAVEDMAECTEGAYRELPGISASDILALQCGFYSEHDEIIIVPTTSPFDSSLPWQENINDQDAVWLIDAGDDSKVNLIIRFSSDQSSVSAEIFDDVDGDGEVAYQVEAGQINVTETDFPIVRVHSSDPKWQQGEQPNYNLDVEVDGPVSAMASYGRYLDLLATDGLVDFRIKVRDADSNGVAEYDLRQDTSDLPQEWGLYSLNLAVDTANHPQPVKDYILWPLLGTAYGEAETTSSGGFVLAPYENEDGMRYGLVQGHDFLTPLIQVDWDQSKVKFLAEMVPTRATEGGWFTYSIPKYEPGKLYEGNFENPFAFYDLAANGDGVPELLIRAESYGANDYHYMWGSVPVPNTMIRYVWKQADSSDWDYAVNLLGRYSTTVSPVVLDDDLAIKTIPYEAYPDWVLDEEKEWDAATFVQAVDGFQGLEGIYEWSGLNEVRDTYAAGLGAEPYLESFLTIERNYHGEYAVGKGLGPYLYFSPIDRQLHLLNADGGVWNIDDRQMIRYEAVGGAHINHWSLLQNDELVEELFTSDGTLIHQKADSVEIVNSDVPAALFSVMPPANNAQWQQLGSRLEDYQPDFAPTDFQAMLDQFDGLRMQIENARVHEFRATENGYRLVLELLPGYSARGTAVLPIGELDPGIYEVVNRDSAIDVSPAMTSAPSITLGMLVAGKDDNEAGAIRATLQNESTIPVNNVWLVITAVDKKGYKREIDRQPLELGGFEHREFTYSWQDLKSENSVWQAMLQDGNGQTIAEAELPMSGTSQPGPPAIVESELMPLLPLIGGFALLLGLTSFSILNRSRAA